MGKWRIFVSATQAHIQIKSHVVSGIMVLLNCRCCCCSCYQIMSHSQQNLNSHFFLKFWLLSLLLYASFAFQHFRTRSHLRLRIAIDTDKRCENIENFRFDALDVYFNAGLCKSLWDYKKAVQRKTPLITNDLCSKASAVVVHKDVFFLEYLKVIFLRIPL